MGIRGGRSRGSEMPRAKCSTVLGEENGDLRASATHPKQRSGEFIYFIIAAYHLKAGASWDERGFHIL